MTLSRHPLNCVFSFKHDKTVKRVILSYIRDGSLEKWWGWVGNFNFRSLLVCVFFFFRWNPLHEVSFRQILLLFEQWILDSLSMYLRFIHFSTLTTDQSIPATFFNVIFFRNVHTVREEEATWSGQLCCAFFQSLPSGIPLPQPIIMMPHSIHQNSSSVVPSTPKCQSKKKLPV